MLARCALAAVLACASAASANDRPYEATWTAVADEDDDGVWSVEAWATRLGSLRTINVAPEYAFSPTTTLQLEAARAREREGDRSWWSAELEFKQLFNHIARDGYGWGVVATLALARPSSRGWQREEWSVKLPLSVSLWDGDGLLHVNAARSGGGDDGARWDASLAIEREVWRRSRLFAELAREDATTLLHAGVRYWARRDRLALDFSLQRRRSDGGARNGAVIGVGWYDL